MPLELPIGNGAAANSSAVVTKYLKRAYFNEQEHYGSVAGILTGASVTPAVAGDFTFSYPAGTFDSESSTVAFAAQLESTILGAYLGAGTTVMTPLHFEQTYQDDWAELEMSLDRVLGRRAGKSAPRSSVSGGATAPTPG